MECAQLKSVVSLVDSLVRCAHVRRSRVLLSNAPVGSPSLAPVSSKSPTDFSICSILGLKRDVSQSFSSSEYNSDASPPLSPYSDCTSPRPSHRETSPMLTPYSDITRSSSDYESEPDQASTQRSEQPTKKRRQRTTFSPIEVLELERAFRRRPYLLKEDEEELVQRLGITAKSLKYWFQNRRAKSRKLERKMPPVCQTSLPNLFDLPVRNTSYSSRLQSVSRFSSDLWKQGKRMSRPMMESYFEDNQRTVGHQLPFKSSHVPKFHLDQFKIGPAEPARLPYSCASYRYQPY